MEDILEIKLGKIRKILLNLLFKSKPYIFLFIFIGWTLAFFIYCLIIGYLVDNEAFQLAFSALSLFILSIISFLIGLYIYLFVKIKGKNNDIIVFKYEFNPDYVIIRNLKKNNSFLLNKNNIKKYYIIYETLVIKENNIFLFPNDEKVKKELNLNDI